MTGFDDPRPQAGGPSFSTSAGKSSADAPARSRLERAPDDPLPWTGWPAWASGRLRDDGALFRRGQRLPATLGERLRWPLLPFAFKTCRLGFEPPIGIIRRVLTHAPPFPIGRPSQSVSENSEPAAGRRQNSQAGRPRYGWLAATPENSQTRSHALKPTPASQPARAAMGCKWRKRICAPF
jgi:hypothetical protein